MSARQLIQYWFAALLGLSVVLPAVAVEMSDHFALVKGYFPQADKVGELDGQPPSAPVYQGDHLLGYVFFTDDVIKMPAYSGKPIRTLVGFDMKGLITGVTIIHHEEPILVTGVTEQGLQKYNNQYLGVDVSKRVKIGGSERPGYKTIDGLSGASITAIVLNATITRGMREIAIARGLMTSQGKKKQETVQESLGDLYPLWQVVWQERVFKIVVLCLGLFVLLMILILQDWLVAHPTLLERIRTGYLIYTVTFIGWYALAQLSVVNVLTFINSFVHGFSWENFMIDPMLFILWGFVAMTLLLWGRGVYCGWLCPFGATQELLFRIGAKLKLPSFEFPEAVHVRLWAIKYLILLALFGLSMQSLVMAERYAEVEPFKTVFTLHFQREWGYILYALGLLSISLFNRKFYCRYVCALGASLTFPAKFRIFDWLRRRKECGRPCRTCETECEVRAIQPTGEINVNECHYCLDCQVTYWNAYKCPPLVEKRKRRERFAKTPES